jgi:DNA-directed RNA polymerase specialized sigma subunit
MTNRKPIRSMLSILSHREIQVLSLKYEHGLTHAEIGAEIGLERSTVTKCIASAIARLKLARDIDLEFPSPEIN